MSGTKVGQRTNKFVALFIFAALLIGGVIIGSAQVRASGNDIIILQDGLANDWANWSSAVVDLHNQQHARQGNSALATTFRNRGDFVLLHSYANISSNSADAVSFWARGNLGGSPVRVMLADGGGRWTGGVEINPPANAWQKYDIPLSQLGNPEQISGIVWQNAEAWQPPAFYLDDIRLVSWNKPAPEPQQQNVQPQSANTVEPVVVTVSPRPAAQQPQRINNQAAWSSEGNVVVNVNTVSHRIDPNIYGINFADERFAREIGLPLNRWGGNATTRFNYLNNTSNRASDWYFENIAGDDTGSSPNGNSADLFIEQNKRTGTSTIMTMPMIGWTAKDRVRRCGFSVNKYANQDGYDPYFPECGTGTRGGQPIYNNDPRDTSEPINEAFVQGWVRHLNNRFGQSGEGGVDFYSLDNEPFLWNHTHRDVRPNGVGYDEMRDLTYRYASAIKQVDPTAKTLGPVLWGWTAFEFSGVDAEANNWDNPPDRLAHQNIPFVPWYLQQMALYERQNGVRILDYLDLHFYPQSPGVGLSPVGDRATQELRMRSTRLLWDKSYVEEYWIEEPTYLIPLMHNWVNANYPGTKLALTEYNWGGLESMNGAVAQADILGIFGREALDIAALWAPGESHEPWAHAFRMYRNYDGRGSRFGDQSVAVGSPNPSVYGVYAARRSTDGAVTVMVVNKSWGDAALTVQLQGLDGGSAEIYRYSAANIGGIVNLGNGQLSGNQFGYNFPGQSITLFVIK